MSKKLEHQTGLVGTTLVSKSHPRILLRGKLDSLHAQTVLTQCELSAAGAEEAIQADFGQVLRFICEIGRCEVLDETFMVDSLFGLSFAELREQSHNPQKYFGIAPMTRPECEYGKVYALLNVLRAAVREVELAAVTAFETEAGVTRPDLVTALNRLSSGLHILMCRVMQG